MEMTPKLLAFGHRITKIFKRLDKRTVTNAEVLDELIDMVQAALVKSNIEFNLMDRMKDIVEKAKLINEIPGTKGLNRVMQVCIFEHLFLLLEIPREQLYKPTRGQPNVILMVGLHDTYKQNHCVRMAYQFQMRYYKACVVFGYQFTGTEWENEAIIFCRDLDVPYYYNSAELDSLEIAKEAVETCKSKGYDMIIVDTNHRNDASLFQEMIPFAHGLQPDDIVMVRGMSNVMLADD